MSGEGLNTTATQAQLAAHDTSSCPPWHIAREVPLRVAVTVPIPSLKVRDLYTLHAGAMLTTGTPAADDVCVRVGGALMAWAELDNVDGRMAVRLTRLA